MVRRNSKSVMWGAFAKRQDASRMGGQLKKRGIKARVVSTRFYRLKLTPIKRRK